MQARFIAIEGPDGSGKSTQVKLLIEHLELIQLPVRYIHFPQLNEGIFGTMIARFLRGEYGQAEQVHPELVALLFAQDRLDFAPTLRSWLSEGFYVIVDRYVFSNLAYQGAKLNSQEEKQKLWQWIYALEYEYNKIPRPDISFYLHVPNAFTENTLSNERQGTDRVYLAGQDDIHEKDYSFQEKVKQEYALLSDFDASIQKINCCSDQGGILPAEEINNLLLKRLGLAKH